jgi:hypothetical protein
MATQTIAYIRFRQQPETFLLSPLYFHPENNSATQQQQQSRYHRRRHMLIDPPPPQTVFLEDASMLVPSYFVTPMESELLGIELDPISRTVGAPDFADLDFNSLVLAKHFQREIYPNDLKYLNTERRSLLREFDKIADDEHEIIEHYQDMDHYLASYPTAETPLACAPQPWQYQKHQVCNNVHELSYDRLPYTDPTQQYDISELSNGHYRQTYLFKPIVQQRTSSTSSSMNATPAYDPGPDIVIKNLRFQRELDMFNFFNINKEAVIMEQFSSSKLTSDIYGHCGTTVLVERGEELTYLMVPRRPGSKASRGRIPQTTLNHLQNKTGDVFPMNNFTAEQKLDIAIALAESIALLHGFPLGVIAHDDISLDQWMLSSHDRRVILNDFNNCHPLEWNAQKQKYCRFWASYPGTFKAPEVYGGSHWVNEQVDIWPLGNLIFSLLTGLKPYYNETDEEVIQGLAMKGIPPYLDPRYKTRSYIEGRLVEIMNQCHKLQPEQRVNVFEVVQFLHETKRIAETIHEKVSTWAAAAAKRHRRTQNSNPSEQQQQQIARQQIRKVQIPKQNRKEPS